MMPREHDHSRERLGHMHYCPHCHVVTWDICGCGGEYGQRMSPDGLCNNCLGEQVSQLWIARQVPAMRNMIPGTQWGLN